MRRVNFIETLLQDLRYAFRGLGKSPGFAAVAVTTLTLGIGASMAILTVVNSVLLRSLPFPDANRLLVLFATSPARGVYRDSTSFPDFLDWKGQSQVFTGVAAYRRDRFNVTGGGAPEPIVGLRASHELFKVLRVSPALGRGFDKEEQEGKIPVAVISQGLWMRRFGGDPGVLDKGILLDDVRHSIIGVLPQGFQFPSFTDTDIVVPIPEDPSRSRGYLFAVARLKPGERVTTAQRELDSIAERLEQAFPLTNRGRGVNAVPLQRVAVGDVRTPLLVLLGSAVFVLLSDAQTLATWCSPGALPAGVNLRCGVRSARARVGSSASSLQRAPCLLSSPHCWDPRSPSGGANCWSPLFLNASTCRPSGSTGPCLRSRF